MWIENMATQAGGSAAVADSAGVEDEFRFEPVLETSVLKATVSPDLTHFCSGCR